MILLREAVAGKGAFLYHPKLDQPVQMAVLFAAAREYLKSPGLEALHLFIQEEEQTQWSLKGNSFVMPSHPVARMALGDFEGEA